jgi:CheY-like chemotaxis protein
MPHVVLADDSPTIRKVVELSFAGGQLTAFQREAASIICARPVDVLLADVSCPASMVTSSAGS